MEKWEKAKKLGYLVGEQEYIDKDYLYAYHWLMEQMKKRLPYYEGEYPVWLWTKRPDLRERGKLEKGKQGVLLQVTIEKRNVLLSDFCSWHTCLNNSYCWYAEELKRSCEIFKRTNKEQVLTFKQKIKYYHLEAKAYSLAKEEFFIRKEKQTEKQLEFRALQILKEKKIELLEEMLAEDIEDFVWGNKLQEEKERSWERIFDFEYLEEEIKKWADFYGDEIRLQGTTGKIMLEDITFIKEFIAR